MSWSQYAAGWAHQHGGYDPRRAQSLPRGWHRFGYRAGRSLVTLGISPRLVTVASLGLATAVPILAFRGPGWLLASAVLVVASALVSGLALAIGVLVGARSARAVIRETAVDRLSEAAWLIGMWLAGVPAPLMLACGIVTALSEYLREQALAAGVSRIAVQTTGGRPSRVVIASGGLVLAGLAGATGFAGGDLAPGVLTMAAAVWLLVGLLGLHQLVVVLRRYLR